MKNNGMVGTTTTVRNSEMNGVTNDEKAKAIAKRLIDKSGDTLKEFESSVTRLCENIRRAEQETWGIIVRLDNPNFSPFIGDKFRNVVGYSHRMFDDYADMLEGVLREAGYENLESEENETSVLNDEDNDLEPNNTRTVVPKPGRRQESVSELGKYGRVSMTANGFVFHMFMPYEEFSAAQANELNAIINQWLNDSRKQCA